MVRGFEAFKYAFSRRSVRRVSKLVQLLRTFRVDFTAHLVEENSEMYTFVKAPDQHLARMLVAASLPYPVSINNVEPLDSDASV